MVYTKKTRIAIYSIFTGNYSVFYEYFVKSIMFDFLPECDKTFFICTDKPLPDYKWTRGKVKSYTIDGGSFNTFKRYEYFNVYVANDVADYDYVFFINSNARCATTISCEDIDLSKDFTFTLHDNYFEETIDIKPFERNEISTACFSEAWKTPQYVGGRLWGAKPNKLKEMCEVLAKNIRKDLDNDFISIWKGESYLNWFYNTHKDKIQYNLFHFP